MVLGRQILRFFRIKKRRIRGSGTAGFIRFRAKRHTFVVGIIDGRDAGQIDLIGVAAPAALFPDELKLRQLAKGRCDALLTDAKLLRQRLAGEDHEHLTGIVHPAVAPGELKAVQKKGVRHLRVQTHIRISRVGK